jgi:hypothetical protein
MRDGRSILHYPSARTDWSQHIRLLSLSIDVAGPGA